MSISTKKYKNNWSAKLTVEPCDEINLSYEFSISAQGASKVEALDNLYQQVFKLQSSLTGWNSSVFDKMREAEIDNE